LKKRLIDQPNARKVHTCVSSRLGGVAFLPSIVIAICVSAAVATYFNPWLWVSMVTPQFMLGFCACMMIYFIGMADDLADVRYRVKFVFQIASALLIILSGIWIDNLHGVLGVGQIPPLLGIPMTIFLIVFVVNALNLIDGIDGLASGLSILAVLVFGILFIVNGCAICALISLATLGALLAFFYYNMYGVTKKHYKIFMGDAGALTIGFVLSVLSIKLCQSNAALSEDQMLRQFIFAYSMLMVPCLDVVRVVLHRYRAKQPLFEPDKSHIHHKFMALGLPLSMLYLATCLTST
ncbi:MAG: MraY family glycosyltransferase, partial [Alistipes sp.]